MGDSYFAKTEMSICRKNKNILGGLAFGFALEQRGIKHIQVFLFCSFFFLPYYDTIRTGLIASSFCFGAWVL